MSGDSRTRQDELRGRTTEDVVGRGREDAIRDTPDETVRIRTEIARTREDMSETIDEIQDRLSPRNLVSQAKESVKEQTVGRVKKAARNVGESASELVDQTRGAASEVPSTVRENPWPALLIGCGTAWLLFDSSRRYRASTESDYAYDYEGSGTMNEYESSAARSAYNYGSAGYEPHTGRTGYQPRAGAQLRRASWRFQELMQRNPLVVGAVAAAVGVAVGLALPETERENRLMGEARDSLVERAQDAAQGAVQKAKQVAGDTAQQVAGEAAKQVVTGSRPRE
jgi:ElaB/YqjD/DUF883 family membrane-anchored ribosome-binding protein